MLETVSRMKRLTTTVRILNSQNACLLESLVCRFARICMDGYVLVYRTRYRLLSVSVVPPKPQFHIGGEIQIGHSMHKYTKTKYYYEVL